MREFINHKRVIVVANPISGMGKACRCLADVASVFRKAGWETRAVFTERPGHARYIAGNFKGGIIISFGGDGTFNEILNGADLSENLLSIIPAGTGNALAKELRMPFNPVRAALAIINGRAVNYDLAKANGRRFMFACGAGLDARVIKFMHRQRSGTITQLHYLPILARSLFAMPEWDIRVRVDQKILVKKVNLVSIGNIKSYGGAIEMTPHADPRDGLLDVTAARLYSFLDVLSFALPAFTRGLTFCKYTRCARGRMVVLDSAGNNIPYHIDGEYGGNLPLTVRTEENPVRLVCPTDEYERSVMLKI